VGSPTAAPAPHRQVSPTRRAGFPPMRTVVLPMGNRLAVGAWAGGGMGQTWLSVATAAGRLPINTVGTPGPTITPPWVLTSVTRAAAGMFKFPFQLSGAGAMGVFSGRIHPILQLTV
jgi:hypothetical protein